MQNGHTASASQVLLCTRGAHVLGAAAIDHFHALGAEQLRLYGGIHGGHAAADHHHAAAHGHHTGIGRLAQRADEFHRIHHAAESLARYPELIRVGESQAQEYGVVFPPQSFKLLDAGELPAALERDAAHAQKPFDLALGVIRHRLVGGDAILVEAPGLGSGIVET